MPRAGTPSAIASDQRGERPAFGGRTTRGREGGRGAHPQHLRGRAGREPLHDIEVEWAEQGPDGTASKRSPAAGTIFRFTPGDWRFDWHTATRRQYVINLDGPNQITASDGETRIIGTGEVILIEDMHGKGHLSQAVDGMFRHSILIPVE